ncbi:amino acid adenylation domain-containing protein [Streptomyces sp. NPDC005474]|uniref:amino acid adenylation domain-containing protein n=1 Tax=Streptomyces sp. NPDC005474 TaxID=3154878 RepID=UPI003452A06C
MTVSGVYGAFARAASRWPDRTAVSDDSRSLTYAELERAAEELAGRLRAAGAGRGTLVGLCADRGVGLIAAMLAVLRTGAAYVPMDPGYPDERLRLTLSDAGCRILLGGPGLDERLGVHDIPFLTVDPPAAGHEPAGEPEQVCATDAAYVIYTSGSTGRPKGVRVTQANVLRLFSVTEEKFAFGPEDVWTMFHSAAFDFSVWEIWGALLHGGRLVVVPYAVTRDPDAMWELLRAERVTVLSQTPTAFTHLIAAAGAAGFPGTSLRTVVFGGEALHVATLRPWIDRYGTDAPSLINMYGITETTVHVTHRPVTRADLDRPGSPIGAPLADLTLHLLDDRLEPVPDGETGELFVGGAGVADGYLNRPDLTAQRFLPDPAGGGGRLYRTGDLAARRPDGELEYRGRRDHQVKLRGFRIELGEIERTLTNHPLVAAAAVVLDETDPGHPRLASYLVLSPDADPDATERDLRDHLARHLPPHMVPATSTVLAALPLTSNGKLDRTQLPAPDRARTATEPEDGPQGEIETSVAALFDEVLGCGPVARHRGFFDLGGDSLLAVRLMARLRRAFAMDLPIRALLNAPTVAGLAQAVVEALVAEMDEMDEESLGELLAAEETRDLEPGNPTPRPDAPAVQA